MTLIQIVNYTFSTKPFILLSSRGDSTAFLSSE